MGMGKGMACNGQGWHVVPCVPRLPLVCPSLACLSLGGVVNRLPSAPWTTTPPPPSLPAAHIHSKLRTSTSLPFLSRPSAYLLHLPPPSRAGRDPSSEASQGQDANPGQAKQEDDSRGEGEGARQQRRGGGGNQPEREGWGHHTSRKGSTRTQQTTTSHPTNSAQGKGMTPS